VHYPEPENIIMKRSTLAVLVTLVCASAPLTVTPASAQQSKAPAQIDQLSAFIGDGTCTGNMMAMGKSPRHATTAHVHGEQALDGNWILVRYDEDRTAANPRPYHVAQNLGYDRVKKQYVAASFDNTGSSYATGTSAGWKGDTLTFDETAAADGATFRDTFTRNGAQGFRHIGTMRDKNGKWVETDEESCRQA
jgi:hypothetical protein